MLNALASALTGSSDDTAFQELWHDNEVRFDLSAAKFAMRVGETALDSLNSVEDTKAGSGDRGKLQITNLRLLWQSHRKAGKNISEWGGRVACGMQSGLFLRHHQERSQQMGTLTGRRVRWAAIVLSVCCQWPHCCSVLVLLLIPPPPSRPGIGLGCIQSMAIKTAQSLTRGTTQALLVTTKFQDTRLEFIFTSVVRSSPRLFVTAQSVLR